MTHIKISKGLDIPIEGAPQGSIQPLPPGRRLALNLKPFDDIAFRLLVKPGDLVKVGMPLVEDKKCPGRFFVSPASGSVQDIVRGEKRHPQNIIIELGRGDEQHPRERINAERASRDELVAYLMEGGIFAYIRRRPFNLLALPTQEPRAIFVKALESAPFVPPAELQVEGREREFATGLKALTKLTKGPVHLVHRKDSPSAAFTQAEGVERHTAEGPHPIANASLHISLLSPITRPDDVVWTVTALDVVRMGHLLLHGQVLNERVVSIAGSAILPNRRGYYRVKDGISVSQLIAEKISHGFHRLVSGDLLTGAAVDANDYLGFYHNTFCAIPEGGQREFLHFFRLGLHKYTASGAYLAGHLDNSDRAYVFTTSLHGERRAIVTSEPYDKVMPLRVPTVPLIKAVMADDFELADTLGLLEVDPEDFALPTFVCPSKVEMTEIIRKGLKAYALQVAPQ